MGDEAGTRAPDRSRTHPVVLGVGALAALTAAATFCAAFVVLAFVFGYGMASVIIAALCLPVAGGVVWSRRVESG